MRAGVAGYLSANRAAISPGVPSNPVDAAGAWPSPRTWTILADGKTVIGLFHGMFEKNLMTFNPGWEGSWQPAAEFTDVRELRSELADSGIDIYADTTAESAAGPASFMITDPDGNQILIDQHV